MKRECSILVVYGLYNWYIQMDNIAWAYCILFMERNDQLAVLMYLAQEENREERGIPIFDVWYPCINIIWGTPLGLSLYRRGLKLLKGDPRASGGQIHRGCQTWPVSRKIFPWNPQDCRGGSWRSLTLQLLREAAKKVLFFVAGPLWRVCCNIWQKKYGSFSPKISWRILFRKIRFRLF